jgi:hypothetical protein
MADIHHRQRLRELRKSYCGNFLSDILAQGLPVLGIHLGTHVEKQRTALGIYVGPCIHTLALVELIVNFTRFYRCILNDLSTTPNQIEFRIEVKNMHLGNRKTSPGTGEVSLCVWNTFGGPQKEAPVRIGEETLP